MMSRREFIKLSSLCSFAALSLPELLLAKEKGINLADGKRIFVTKEAMFYEKLSDEKVKCKLCPKECQIGDRERGWCGVRENRKGTYYTLVHSNPCAVHVDPIEKKPFFHFLPASLAFSISTAGCNFNCKYCQNWQISQRRPEQTENVYLPPEEVVKSAKKSGCKSIAYTYAEPTVFYEYMYDTSLLARKEGIRAIVVTAGYMQREPIERLCEAVDAIKIDLKAFRDKFYREICSGTLQPVLDNLKTIKERGVWLEIVDLVVPTLNDSLEEFHDLSSWVLDNLGPDVPLHFSRFYPMYQLKNLPPTPMATLEKAREIALKKGLNYVYLGNVPPMHEGNNTYCPKCGKLLIERRGFFVVRKDITNVNGKCKCDCGYEIPGVWA
jgi:pyruvate formate lyase activating enzyme